MVVTHSIWDEHLTGPFIIDLFIDPHARGKGIGRALVQHAIATCCDAGVPRQVVGRISLVLNVGVVGSARPRCTSLGRFHEMASWGRSSLYSIR